jgi:hypothetical protein
MPILKVLIIVEFEHERKCQGRRIEIATVESIARLKQERATRRSLALELKVSRLNFSRTSVTKTLRETSCSRYISTFFLQLACNSSTTCRHSFWLLAEAFESCIESCQLQKPNNSCWFWTATALDQRKYETDQELVTSSQHNHMSLIPYRARGLESIH